MYNIKFKDILEATGGVLLSGTDDVQINDICIDSRAIKEGDLFVPIVGENQDAHMFIENALNVGAATLTSRHNGVVISEKPYIHVNDTKDALRDIGKYIRQTSNIPFIGVTGSVGKTTTREMIATALSGGLNVYQTEGNLNSQVGVPITISRINKEAEVAVLEMGISEFGEMEILSSLVMPNIAVITMIGVAHIEHLKTRENIRLEKLNITNGMNEDGVLFLNGNDEMLSEIRGETKTQTLYYGTKSWCDYRAEDIEIFEDHIEYNYVHNDTKIPVYLSALGMHNVGNSLVGMAIVDYMGLDIKAAADKFRYFKGLRQRIIRVPNKYVIIDDTYNASPDSVKASINVLCDMVTTGKKIAVLGDMLELGDKSEQYHYEIGKFIADKNIDELVVIGELSQKIKQAVEESDSKIACYSFKDNGEIILYLTSVMNADDVALIKGSNGMKLYEIVKNMED